MTDNTKAVATAHTTGAAANDMLGNPVMFEHMQRVAKMFMKSELIPPHLKKNDGADAFLALQIARERGESPVAVMQNIYFVSGRAGWTTAYMIGRANKSGAFKGRIKWRTTGKGDDLEVQAYAIAADDGEECSATVSMRMAAAEGWTRNPKYKTMPEHMLKWRAATMLIRLYCPEVLHGMRSEDELQDGDDAQDITNIGAVITTAPEPRRGDFKPAAQQQAAAAPEPEREQERRVEEPTWLMYDYTGEEGDEFYPAVAWLDRFTQVVLQADDPAIRAGYLRANEDTAVDILTKGGLTDEQKEGLRGFYDPPAEEQQQARDWTIPDNIVGQDKKLAALWDLLTKTQAPADVEDLAVANEAFLAKLTGLKKAEVEKRLMDRKISLGQQQQAAE